MNNIVIVCIKNSVPIVTIFGICYKIKNYIKLMRITYLLLKIQLYRFYYKTCLIIIAMKTIDNIVYIHNKLS